MYVSTILSCNKTTLISFYGAIAKYQNSNHFGCAKLFCRSWDAAAGTNLDTPGAANFVVEISHWCRKYKRLTSEKVCFSWSREDFQNLQFIWVNEICVMWSWSGIFIGPIQPAQASGLCVRNLFWRETTHVRSCFLWYQFLVVLVVALCCFLKEIQVQIVQYYLYTGEGGYAIPGGCGQYANWMVLARLWDVRGFFSNTCVASE